MPPISELTRIEPVYLGNLAAHGIFTTGLLLEVSETPTRRQYLADQLDATINDVAEWRDEALMLNLASFGPEEHELMLHAGIDGLRDILSSRRRCVPGARRPSCDRARHGPPGRPADRRLVGAGADARRGVTRGSSRDDPLP